MMNRKSIWLAALLGAGLVLPGARFLPQPLPVAVQPSQAAASAGLRLYFIDVEGGAATLIVTPAGESVLVDTGNPGGRDAERIFRVANEVAGLQQIDHLVTTHWHIDHYGGAAELAKRLPVKEVLDKGIPEQLSEDPKFADNIRAYREMAVTKRTRIQPGMALNLRSLSKGLPPLQVRLVGVDKKFVPHHAPGAGGAGCAEAPEKAADTSDNANSLVLVVDYGPFRFFDGGDLTWNTEKSLVCPTNLVGPVDVFQVNHHGMDSSNNPVLVKNLAPTVSIMNNGTHKGCGPETVTTLRSTPSIQANYQLHKNLRPDSEFNTQDAYIANLEANCQANYIALTVAPDGRQYTVSIPATKHSQTFKTKKAVVAAKKKA